MSTSFDSLERPLAIPTSQPAIHSGSNHCERRVKDTRLVCRARLRLIASSKSRCNSSKDAANSDFAILSATWGRGHAAAATTASCTARSNPTSNSNSRRNVGSVAKLPHGTRSLLLASSTLARNGRKSISRARASRSDFMRSAVGSWPSSSRKERTRRLCHHLVRLRRPINGLSVVAFFAARSHFFSLFFLRPATPPKNLGSCQRSSAADKSCFVFSRLWTIKLPIAGLSSEHLKRSNQATKLCLIRSVKFKNIGP